MDEFNFTEQDLQDPSLLEELAALGISDKTSTEVTELEITTEFDDVHVQFDEKDMDDPQLLRDLQGLQDTGIVHSYQDAFQNTDDDIHNNNTNSDSFQLEGDDNLLRELEQNEIIKPNISPSIDQLPDLQGKVLEFKKTALKFKREKNLPMAREALIASKKVQEQIDRIKSGFAVSPGFSLPNITQEVPVVQSVDASKAHELRKSIKKESMIEKVLQVVEHDPLQEIEIKMESKDIFKHLSDLLNEQIKTCTNLSGYYFKSGKKDKALEFHKYKKRFLGDLESLTALSKTNGATPPTFSYFQISYDIEARNPELSQTELLFSIIKGYDFNTFQGNELFISFKIETFLEETTEISLERENNPERKKCLLELYSCTTQFLFMKKKTLLAKCSLKLDNLLHKCEIHDIVNFTDPNNPRKSLNSKVELKLCLSQPLLKPEIITKEERWIQISFNTAPSTQIQTVAATTTNTLVRNDITPKSKSPVPSTDETSDELEDELLSFKNVDLIVSNLVLEHESNEISKEIQKITSQGRPVPAELSDQLLSYEIKMNLLVSLVQMGTLTPEAYINDLTSSLKETKRLAILFKKFGKLDEAQKAMIRIKLMTKEISEIS